MHWLQAIVLMTPSEWSVFADPAAPSGKRKESGSQEEQSEWYRENTRE